jgi:hypothetical protein
MPRFTQAEPAKVNDQAHFVAEQAALGSADAARQQVGGAHCECGGTDGGRESGRAADVVGRGPRPTAERWPVLDAPEVHVAASQRYAQSTSHSRLALARVGASLSFPLI